MCLTIANRNPSLVIDEIGSILLGGVVGWVLMVVVRRRAPDWMEFCGGVVIILAASGLLNLIRAGLLGYFWIGIFAGFVANIIVRRFPPAL